jgi:alanine racemase
MPSARTVAEIDLEAIRHNIRLLLDRAAGRIVVVDVAADGYGHGASAVLRAAVEAGGSAVVPAHEAPASSGHALFAAGALYGLGGGAGLRPAMRVSSVVISTRTIDAGEGVSYGLTYRATARTNLALVGIGYADGLDRSAGNVARVLVGTESRRIVGRVAMNALVVELGEAESEVGERVVVFGDPTRDEPHVTAWAASIDRPPDEVTSVFGRHIERTYR